MNAVAPRININSEIGAAESKPFIGRITLDALEPGKFQPWQWCLAVMPVKFVVKGIGFREYVPLKEADLMGNTSEASKFGIHLKAFKTVFGENEDVNIGEGELEGKLGLFKKYTHSFGYSEKEQKEFTSSMLVPVRLLTDEEYEEIGEEPEAPKLYEFTDEQVALVVKTLDGLAKGSFQKACFKAKMPADLLTAVVNGTAVDYVTDQGKAYFNNDGIFTAAE